MAVKKNKNKKSHQSKASGLENKLKRALADYDNLEKRIIIQRERFVVLAKVEILDKFVSVLDDLERAEGYLKNKGLSLAIDQFRAVIKSEGVEEVRAKGRVFDPEEMDCVGMVSGKKNRVINVAQKGYLIKNKVIRPAKVEVGSGRIKVKKLSN